MKDRNQLFQIKALNSDAELLIKVSLIFLTLVWSISAVAQQQNRLLNTSNPALGSMALKAPGKPANNDEDKPSKTGWDWETIDVNRSETFHDVDFNNGKTGLAVGGSGLILKSSDGGKSWDESTRMGTPDVNLRNISFANDEVGAIAAEGTIIWTGNGGKAWHEAAGAKETSNDIAFAYPKVAVAVGDGGTILRSRDAGKSWQEVDYTPKVKIGEYTRSVSLQSVSFLNKQVGIAIGFTGTSSQSGTIVRTADGGKSWQEIEGVSGILTNSLALDNQVFLVMDKYGGMLISRDRGKSWNKHSLGESVSSLKSLALMKGQQPVAMGDKEFYASTDNFKSWHNWQTNTSADLKKVRFFSNKKALALSYNAGVLLSSDKGKNWKQVARPKGELNDITMLNDQVGFISATGGRIYRTDDGGRNWNTVGRPGGDIIEVEFVNNKEAYALSGHIYYTNDKGKTWEEIDPGIDGFLTGIAFATPDKGLITVRNGHVLRTINGGKTWKDLGMAARVSAHSSTEEAIMKDIAFNDKKVGMAVGYEFLVRTPNAGVTGNQKQNPAPNTCMLSVSFVDNNRVVAVGKESTMLVSEDGGENWQKSDLSNFGLSENAWLYEIAFENGKQGMIAGRGYTGGVLVYSPDKGKHWIKSDYPDNSLKGVDFPSRNSVVAVGYDGTIIRGTR